MKRSITKKLMCAVVAGLFSINDIAYGLGPMPGSRNPATQDRVYSALALKWSAGKRSACPIDFNALLHAEEPNVFDQPGITMPSPRVDLRLAVEYGKSVGRWSSSGTSDRKGPAKPAFNKLTRGSKVAIVNGNERTPGVVLGRRGDFLYVLDKETDIQRRFTAVSIDLGLIEPISGVEFKRMVEQKRLQHEPSREIETLIADLREALSTEIPEGSFWHIVVTRHLEILERDGEGAYRYIEKMKKRLADARFTLLNRSPRSTKSFKILAPIVAAHRIELKTLADTDILRELNTIAADPDHDIQYESREAVDILRALDKPRPDYLTPKMRAWAENVILKWRYLKAKDRFFIEQHPEKRGSSTGAGAAAEETSVKLTRKEIQNIWETVNLFHAGRIEIILPKQMGLTGTMGTVLSAIRKREGQHTIKRVEYLDKEDLREILLKKTEDGVKRIVLTENGMSEEIRQFVQDRANSGLFRGVRLLNIVLPDDYTTMPANIKTFHQARIVMMAVLARLYEGNENSVAGLILKSMLEGCVDTTMTDFLNGLVESEEENLDADKTRDRILACLGKPVSLVTMIGQAMERVRLMMEEFWTKA